MFDPIQEKRSQKYTRAELKQFWQGPDVQRTKRENPALYQELQDAGVAANVIGKSLSPRPAPNVYKPPTKTYTPEELAARGNFTENQCRELFASGDSSAAKALFESDPERYQDAKDSAIAHGILPPRLTPRPQPAPVATPKFTLRISDQLADESNLPRGTVVDEDQLTQLCSQSVQRAREKQEAADAKVAQDRATELEKLTAAQKLEQAVRDRHQADLDRLVELTTPRQTPVPEPAPLAAARLVAQEKAKIVELPVKA